MCGDRTFASLVIAVSIIAAIAFASAGAGAQEFSADLVHTDTAGRPDARSGKIFVSNRHVRIETPDLPDGFFILDGDRDAAYFVRPAQRIFMDAKQSSSLTQILVPVDVGDPCRQWQAMASIAGAVEGGRQWRCERIGATSIGERDTLEYVAVSPQDRKSRSWIDVELKFPIRFQSEDGTAITLENIRQGEQPATLFEISTDYRKFDPLGLIERIKRSDVWVDPPQ
jgi:hypothetical protein